MILPSKKFLKQDKLKICLIGFLDSITSLTLIKAGAINFRPSLLSLINNKNQRMRLVILITILVFSKVNWSRTVPSLKFTELDSSLKKELARIDSIVLNIDENCIAYNVDSAYGKTNYANRKRDGHWNTIVHYSDSNKNIPIRVHYNRIGPDIGLLSSFEDSNQYEFYYENGKLIFAKIEIKYFRKNSGSKIVSKCIYFKDEESIYDTNPNTSRYLKKHTYHLLNQNESLALKSILLRKKSHYSAPTY